MTFRLPRQEAIYTRRVIGHLRYARARRRAPYPRPTRVVGSNPGLTSQASQEL